MIGRLAVLLILLPPLLPLTGCTSVQETFRGRDPEQVWSALVATARSPNYDDMDAMKRWEVRENEVWVNENRRRIEIYRRLHRFVHQSASRRHLEMRRYAITVEFDPDPIPAATFIVREGAIPARAREAAERYWAGVRRVLEGPPDLPDLPPASDPSPVPGPASGADAQQDIEPEEVIDRDGPARSAAVAG